MASSIDATKPTAGAALTADVRNNFSAAKTEIEALQAAVASALVAKAGDTMTGALNWSATQTIASAATTDIGAATSNSVIVSGTTTITGLGTIAAGAERVVQFSGALTLTHNATSLILPGGASITTAAGDGAYFVSLGAGNWRCTGYQKANGQAVVASGATLDLAEYLKQCGPTHESGWVGDYTIGAVLRPLASGKLRGVRLWWPMSVSCNATITVYRSGASPVAAVSRSFTPGEVATAFFDVPLDVVAGEYLMVCVYGGGVGHPHAIVTEYLPITQPLILDGFVMQGYTWYVAGNAKPNAQSTEPYRPLFWPVV